MIFAISNRKGGVGKTTTAINLGAALAKQGKCLLVDLDPQASLTRALGITSPEATIYEALTNRGPLAPVVVNNGLEVVPATSNLAGAEAELMNEPGREVILRQLLKPLRRKYDWVFLDCPPSLGVLTINALVATDRVLAPVQSQFLSIQGLLELDEIIKTVKARLNNKIVLGGIALTQFDGRKNLDREVAEEVRKRFGKKVFKTAIRSNVSLAEAPAKGRDIFSYSPNSHGAEDYRSLATEFKRRSRGKR